MRGNRRNLVKRSSQNEDRLSVPKKSTRSWTGMPFARKSKIFGLHSIPANTTPVSLKNRLFSGFSLTRCFSAAPVSGKTKKAALPPQKQNLGFIDRLKCCTRFSGTAFFNNNLFWVLKPFQYLIVLRYKMTDCIYKKK